MTKENQNGDASVSSAINVAAKGSNLPVPVDLAFSIIDELEWGGQTASHNADKLRLLMGGKDAPLPEIANEESVVKWLCQAYVQRSDDRQKAMGLQYTEAETHDLAASFFLKFVRPLQAQIALLEKELEVGAHHAQ